MGLGEKLREEIAKAVTQELHPAEHGGKQLGITNGMSDVVRGEVNKHVKNAAQHVMRDLLEPFSPSKPKPEVKKKVEKKEEKKKIDEGNKKKAASPHRPNLYSAHALSAPPREKVPQLPESTRFHSAPSAGTVITGGIGRIAGRIYRRVRHPHVSRVTNIPHDPEGPNKKVIIIDPVTTSGVVHSGPPRGEPETVEARPVLRPAPNIIYGAPPAGTDKK